MNREFHEFLTNKQIRKRITFVDLIGGNLEILFVKTCGEHLKIPTKLKNFMDPLGNFFFDNLFHPFEWDTRIMY